QYNDILPKGFSIIPGKFITHFLQLPKVPKLEFVEKAVGRDLIKKSFQSYKIGNLDLGLQ
ncbi:MAG: hypothetical protein QMD44_13330, partial [Thermodesulfovibrionales bacterium]|nr:hypothetical protein [Thermodesulfovibrionales bacterium]